MTFERICLLILTVAYAVQAAMSVDAQKQLNEIADKLYKVKKRNDEIFNLIAEKTNDETK